MSTRTIKTRLQIRRDTEAAFESIKNSFVPLKGEILLIDTTSGELRSKIGDGATSLDQLQYSDQYLRNMVSGIVVHGYYYNSHFYADEQHTIKLVGYTYKIYIDIPTSSIYAYFDTENKYYKLADVPNATSTEAGIMKLYDETGSNTDGTMTQLSITTELHKKFSVKCGQEEDLIFTSI